MRFFHACCIPSYGRRFGITRLGRFCLVPESTQANDIVCIPAGARVPFVLTRMEGQYRNKGECYLHGGMHGEASPLDGTKLKTFDIW